MLTDYLVQTRGLLQNPSAPTQLYTDSDLTRWINIARGQLAGESLCVRIIGNLVLAAGTKVYNFSSINIGNSINTGAQGTINVSTIWLQVGAGQKRLEPRGWEWFGLYHLNTPVPQQKTPKVWSQYGQGAAPPGTPNDLATAINGGSIYFDPIPDTTYTALCDCTCYPIPLAVDTDIEAIPYLWTDAVPYFAAYLALLSSQTSQRSKEAATYLQLYQQFVQRARAAANPLVNNSMYQQAPDPVKLAKMAAERQQ